MYMKMTKVILDANILVALTIEDHEFHEEAVKKVNDINLGLIPVNLLVEFIIVLKNLKISEEFIIKKIEEFRDNFVFVEVFPEDFINAIEYSKRLGISLEEINELILISIDARTNSYLFTYDKKLILTAKKLKIPIF